jgi:hypothetical protein
MGEEAGVEAGPQTTNSGLPFRMLDITLAKPFPNHLPMADVINTVRKELVFQWKLLRSEWNRAHYMTIGFGFLALLLGSVSTELWNGGDAKITGLDGVLAISGFQFFQILVSIICWGWFAYQALMLFPIMRVHAISLLLMWNGLIGAQIFFHRNNPNFPGSFNISEMMEGTLVLLVVFFFLFCFWKAVV